MAKEYQVHCGACGDEGRPEVLFFRTEAAALRAGRTHWGQRGHAVEIVSPEGVIVSITESGVEWWEMAAEFVADTENKS
jgi:hypothetical protein